MSIIQIHVCIHVHMYNTICTAHMWSEIHHKSVSVLAISPSLEPAPQRINSVTDKSIEDMLQLILNTGSIHSHKHTGQHNVGVGKYPVSIHTTRHSLVVVVFITVLLGRLGSPATACYWCLRSCTCRSNFLPYRITIFLVPRAIKTAQSQPLDDIQLAVDIRHSTLGTRHSPLLHIEQPTDYTDIRVYVLVE